MSKQDDTRERNKSTPIHKLVKTKSNVRLDGSLRRPTMIYHMSGVELRALRGETIAALLAAPFGTTRRAEKLCRSIKKSRTAIRL